MKLSTRLSQVFPAGRSDWRQRNKNRRFVIPGIAVLAYAVGTFYDFALMVFQFGMDHSDWDADDIIFVVFVLGGAMTVYGFHRYQDLSREIKARITAEREARELARHDPLTGLPNRRFFVEKLDECLSDVSEKRVMRVKREGLDWVSISHSKSQCSTLAL